MFIETRTKIGLFVLTAFFSTIVSAQPAPSEQDEQVPADYLSKEFHWGHREALRELMPAKSVMVVFAYPTRTFSNDVEYLYHQNPDLYHFTGYKEPHSPLPVF